jgi:branched-subunit amino acid transport protein
MPTVASSVLGYVAAAVFTCLLLPQVCLHMYMYVYHRRLLTQLHVTAALSYLIHM